MSLQANGEVYPPLPAESFLNWQAGQPASEKSLQENFRLNLPDFGLSNHYSGTQFFGDSARPDLLASPAPQSLLAYNDSPAPGQDNIPAKDFDDSNWDFLWHGAVRIPINAVPEPTALALLTVGALLLGARKLRSHQ